MALTTAQRLDVQIISNTNIQVSKDLFDRLQETARGPGLLKWCTEVGMLQEGQDFADKGKRGGPISVQAVHSFITNYYLGTKVDSKNFANVETTPIKCPKGKLDPNWDALLEDRPAMLADAGLRKSAIRFSALVKAQRAAFVGRKRVPPDYAEKAMSLPVLAGWAFVSGVLQTNEKRLERLYDLPNTKGGDPLNAEALAKGRHVSDDDSYRGLGYRSDPREMGCFAELFFYHAETSKGITPSAVKIAIAQYFAKKMALEAVRIREREGEENAGD